MVALGSGANRVGRVSKWVELYFFYFVPFPSLPEQVSPHAFKSVGAKCVERQLVGRSPSQSTARGCPCRAPAFGQSDTKQVQGVGGNHAGRVSRQGRDPA